MVNEKKILNRVNRAVIKMEKKMGRDIKVEIYDYCLNGVRINRSRDDIDWQITLKKLLKADHIVNIKVRSGDYDTVYIIGESNQQRVPLYNR